MIRPISQTINRTFSELEDVDAIYTVEWHIDSYKIYRRGIKVLERSTDHVLLDIYYNTTYNGTWMTRYSCSKERYYNCYEDYSDKTGKKHLFITPNIAKAEEMCLKYMRGVRNFVTEEFHNVADELSDINTKVLNMEKGEFKIEE